MTTRSGFVNVPFKPSRFPFFYGWVIMAAGIVATLASIPGQTMGVGVFTDYLIESLNLSRNELSTAYMFGTILSSFILPKAGEMLDRIGVRAMILISSLGLGFSMVFLATTEAAVKYKNLNNIFVTMSVMAFCFLLMRFFGQGCLTMVARVALGKWFNYHRGLASAISGVFVALGFNASPTFLNALVQRFGWQSASLVLAGLVGIGMSIFGWLFFRDNPEECDLIMDGKEESYFKDTIPAHLQQETHKEFTKSEALRTFPFWVFSFALAIVGLILTAVTFHIASLGQEMGLNREQAYALFIPMSLFSIGANFFASWSSDRIKHKWLLAIMMAMQVLGTIGLYFLNERFGQFMFFIGQGIAVGMFVALATVLLPRFYGREHLGAISGFNFSVMVFASAIGPILFSSIQDLTGSYREVLAMTAIIPLVLMILSFYVVNPQLQLRNEV